MSRKSPSTFVILQSKLKRTDLEFTTVAGTEAIVLGRDFRSKIHRGGLSGSVSKTAGAITDPEQISVVRRYLSKLNPKQDCFSSVPVMVPLCYNRMEMSGS